MASHAYEPTGALQLRHLRGQLGEGVLVLAEPAFPPLGFLVDDFVGREVVQFGVVMHVGRLIKIVFSKGPAIVDDQRGRLSDAGLREDLQNVFVERGNWKRVIVAMDAIDYIRSIKLKSQA